MDDTADLAGIGRRGTSKGEMKVEVVEEVEIVEIVVGGRGGVGEGAVIGRQVDSWTRLDGGMDSCLWEVSRGIDSWTGIECDKDGLWEAACGSCTQLYDEPGM